MMDRMNSLESKWENECPPRMVEIVDDLDGGRDCSEILKEVEALKRQVNNPVGTSTRFVKFQDLSFPDLKDIMAWLEKNVPSYNYAIISDFHSVLEHVNHQVNPTKVTLDLLESIRKLEIPTPNHAIMIQSFDAHLPKFLCKNKSHHVTKSDE